MNRIRPKNWSEFQHYKCRTPPWIKLHRGLLDDFAYQRLPVASRALAPMLWLLASEDVAGLIDADHEKLAFRLRITVDEVDSALTPLIEKGFFVVVQSASEPLAECNRDACLETEVETEVEGEGERDSRARDWPIVWKAFLAWPKLPATATETRAKDAYDRAAADLPDTAALVAEIAAQGARLREMGSFATAPHNWLERDGGWRAGRDGTNIKPVDTAAMRGAWNGHASQLIDALGARGDAIFSSWFSMANFEPGPPARIMLPNSSRRMMVQERFEAPLRQAFGEFILEVAA